MASLNLASWPSKSNGSDKFSLALPHAYRDFHAIAEVEVEEQLASATDQPVSEDKAIGNNNDGPKIDNQSNVSRLASCIRSTQCAQ